MLGCSCKPCFGSKLTIAIVKLHILVQVLQRADHHEEDVHLPCTDDHYTALYWDDQVKLLV